MGFLDGVESMACSRYKTEDVGSFQQDGNVLTIYDNKVEIYSELLWDDSVDTFTIERSKELAERDIVPIVKIFNNRRERQPVIGPKTNDNLSYGRYELPRGRFTTLQINECNVTLTTTAVENFTIGAYGTEMVPKLELSPNAMLNCPETSGQRMMQIGPEPLQGSTKHSRSCKYIIWTVNSVIEDFLSPEVLSKREELKALNPEMAEFVGLHTLENGLNKAIELLKINKELDVSKLLTVESNHQSTSIIIGCVVLGLSEECYKSRGEMFYEINRWKELAERYNIPYDDNRSDMFDVISEVIIRKHFEGMKFDELTNWNKKFIYELIPVYSFNFTGKTEEECAKEWWFTVMGGL